jgi:hypothetical protein
MGEMGKNNGSNVRSVKDFRTQIFGNINRKLIDKFICILQHYA